MEGLNQTPRPPSSITAETLAAVKEHIGEKFISSEIEITTEKVQAFLEATGDINPVHLNPETAEKSVLTENSEIIVPGFLTLSMCANRDLIYEALKIGEPFEVINMGGEKVRLLSPVPVNSKLVYEYKLVGVKDKEIKSRKATVVTWAVKAYRVVGAERKICMAVNWDIAYVSVPN